MADKLDGGAAVGPPQIIITGGNVVSPVDAFENNAGIGPPPKVGPYGAIGDDEIPRGEKYPSGNAKAMKAYFGTQKPGGS